MGTTSPSDTAGFGGGGGRRGHGAAAERDREQRPGRGPGRGGARAARLRTGAVLAAGLLLAMSGTATAAALPHDPLARYTGQHLTWGDCAFEPGEGDAPSECALVTVPRDWAHPGTGTDLRVSVSRVRATGESRGAVLVNPGGPGAQGASLAGLVAGLRPQLAESYDLVGMDPRGTGQQGADAGLVCHVPGDQLPQDPTLDARDRSPASIAAHVQRPEAIAKTCAADGLTPYVTTWQTAHDMDLVRALLGESRLNYLGYSYGTWLGAKYASLFPAHTGRVVLDSSVDWQGRLQAAFEDFPRIDQRQFDQVYLPWVVRNLPEHIGGSVAEARATWEKVRALYAGIGVSPDSFDMLFVGMGNELQWLLASAIFEAGAQELAEEGGAGGGGADSASVLARLDDRARDVFGVPLAQLTPALVRGRLGPGGTAAATGDEPATTDVAGTRYAVACGDQPTPSAAWYRRLSDIQGPRYPLFGWAYGLGEVCGHWHGPQQALLPRLPHSAASHVLVVQGEFDPQTAYELARSAVRKAPGTGMVSVDNAAFHGQYALGGNTCVDAAVESFLLDGDRPGRETCPGTPLPGETVVYPTRGPVTGQEQHTLARRDDGTAPAVREAARAAVSEANRPVR